MKVNVTDKLDGFSLILTYQDGKLLRAATRGDGAQGDDITENAVKFTGLLSSYGENETGRVYIRGEGLIPQPIFKKKYFDGSNNARNVGNGMAKARELKGNADFTDIHFVAYEVQGDTEFDSETAKLEWLTSLGFEVPSYKVFSDVDTLLTYQKRRHSDRPSLKYTIDGLVIKIDSIEDQSHFDTVDGRPRGQVAFKFPAPTVVATVTEIKWEMGNSGRFCPVAHVEPVLLGGEVTLRKVSLHNLEQLVKHEVTPGAKILVERAGDVIPHLVRVVKKGVSFLKEAV